MVARIAATLAGAAIVTGCIPGGDAAGCPVPDGAPLLPAW